ncbi:hypothetical protein ABGB07_33950 [Micromonosporaceae bacterium B7E4]
MSSIQVGVGCLGQPGQGGQGHGLLECARRLGWTLNTVKRYARAKTVADLQAQHRIGRIGSVVDEAMA